MCVCWRSASGHVRVACRQSQHGLGDRLLGYHPRFPQGKTETPRTKAPPWRQNRAGKGWVWEARSPEAWATRSSRSAEMPSFQNASGSSGQKKLDQPGEGCRRECTAEEGVLRTWVKQGLKESSSRRDMSPATHSWSSPVARRPCEY